MTTFLDSWGFLNEHTPGIYLCVTDNIVSIAYDLPIQHIHCLYSLVHDNGTEIDKPSMKKQMHEGNDDGATHMVTESAVLVEQQGVHFPVMWCHGLRELAEVKPILRKHMSFT